MADEAYRGVFLRVHPTGKMVLSLTTESDGREAQYAQLVATELGVPPLDVKVVPADTDRFGVGHGFNTSPSEGTSAAVVSASGKIRAKAQLLAGVALEPRPRPSPGSTAPGPSGMGAIPPSSRRSRTSPSTRTAPAPCRRGSRAGSTRRRSTATDRGRCDPDQLEGRPASIASSISSATFRRPEQRRVGLDAPVASASRRGRR